MNAFYLILGVFLLSLAVTNMGVALRLPADTRIGTGGPWHSCWA